jgi:hypothetical protein
MTDAELKERFNAEHWPTPCALIEYNGERGIAFYIGEALSSVWRPGNVIVFWEDGEHTILPDEFDLIQFNIMYYDFTTSLPS